MTTAIPASPALAISCASCDDRTEFLRVEIPLAGGWGETSGKCYAHCGALETDLPNVVPVGHGSTQASSLGSSRKTGISRSVFLLAARVLGIRRHGTPPPQGLQRPASVHLPCACASRRSKPRLSEERMNRTGPYPLYYGESTRPRPDTAYLKPAKRGGARHRPVRRSRPRLESSSPNPFVEEFDDFLFADENGDRKDQSFFAAHHLNASTSPTSWNPRNTTCMTAPPSLRLLAPTTLLGRLRSR